MALGFEEHRRAEHGVREFELPAEQAFRKAVFALLVIVLAHADKDRTAHVAQRLGLRFVESASGEMIRRERIQGIEQPLFGNRVPGQGKGGGAFFTSPSLGVGKTGARQLLGARQRDEGPIEGERLVWFEQLGRQSVVDDVILQPCAGVAVDLGRESSVRSPEGFELLKSVHRVRDADSADELVEVYIGEGEARLLDVALAHRRAPGEISAQLTIAHRVVRGKIRVERARIGAVILEIRHERALPVEQLRLGEPAPTAVRVGLPARDGLHFAIAVGEVVRHLPAGGEDRFARIHAFGEVGAALQALARHNAVYELASSGLRSIHRLQGSPPRYIGCTLQYTTEPNRCSYFKGRDGAPGPSSAFPKLSYKSARRA